MFSPRWIALVVMFFMTAFAVKSIRLIAQSELTGPRDNSVNWLRQKLAAFGGFAFALRNDDGTTVTDTTASIRQNLATSACRITIGSVWDQTSNVYPESASPDDRSTLHSSQINSSGVELRDLDPETINAKDEGPAELAGYPGQTLINGPAHVYVVTVATNEKKTRVEYHGTHKNADGSHEDSTTEISSVDLVFTDPNIAKRAVKALTDAINACQNLNKKEKRLDWVELARLGT
jgi:hypothetical protein